MNLFDVSKIPISSLYVFMALLGVSTFVFSLIYPMSRLNTLFSL